MLIISILYQIISSSVTFRRDKSMLYSRISILIMLYSSILVYNSLSVSSLSKGIGLYNGLFHITPLTQGFSLFILIITTIILFITAFYTRKDGSDKKIEQFKVIEYSLLISFIVSGALLLVCASDLVSVFISIELQSYGLYLLCTIYRNSERATLGGLTYFLLGGLSSCFILLGIALLYVNTGTTNLDNIYIITNLAEYNILSPYNYDNINYALIIMCIGFLFKVAGAPFHTWAPDVYDAIPTVVTTFVALIPKISIFIFMVEIVNHTSDFILVNQIPWTSILALSSLMSLIVGSVLGLSQSRIKRLFAYSTISHVGFILLALSSNSVESLQAFMFYLIQYSLANLNIFLILLSIGWYLIRSIKKEASRLQDVDYSPVQYITQIKGFLHVNTMLGISLSLTIFSFVGIPPLIGFFAKQMVLSSALDNGYIFISLIAILTSVIGAVYYLNLVKEIFFEKPYYIVEREFVTLSGYLSITISILTLIIISYMFVPQELLNATNILSLSLVFS